MWGKSVYVPPAVQAGKIMGAGPRGTVATETLPAIIGKGSQKRNEARTCLFCLVAPALKSGAGHLLPWTRVPAAVVIDYRYASFPYKERQQAKAKDKHAATNTGNRQASD